MITDLSLPGPILLHWSVFLYVVGCQQLSQTSVLCVALKHDYLKFTDCKTCHRVISQEEPDNNNNVHSSCSCFNGFCSVHAWLNALKWHVSSWVYVLALLPADDPNVTFCKSLWMIKHFVIRSVHLNPHTQVILGVSILSCKFGFIVKGVFFGFF